MNQKNLALLMQHYAERFEELNNETNCELYKWEIAAQFRPMMDEALSAPNEAFPEKLRKVVQLTEQTIDNKAELAFFALSDYARYEPDTVRRALQTLFADDGGDLTARKQVYDGFLSACEALHEKYAPNSWRYHAGMRLPMCLTAYYDPDAYYFYKPEQGKAFADCVGFPEDWGSGTNIHLRTYYRMCDAVAEAIRADAAFAALAARRRALSGKPIHPDAALHLQTFDLIFCSTVYNLFAGIDYTAPDSASRRAYRENREKAERLLAEQQEAFARVDRLNAAEAFFMAQFAVGKAIRHKTYGEGVVLRYVSRTVLEAAFPSQQEPKRLVWNLMVQSGLLLFDDADAPMPTDELLKILKLSDVIRRNAEQAEEKLKAFEQYLD